jgi:hypothetical protein
MPFLLLEFWYRIFIKTLQNVCKSMLTIFINLKRREREFVALLGRILIKCIKNMANNYKILLITNETILMRYLDTKP